MKRRAGGKLKTKNPMETPNKLHATVDPNTLSVMPGSTRYAAAMIPVTPAHRPSAPSRKLKQLINSTVRKQTVAKLAGPALSHGNRQPPHHSRKSQPDRNAAQTRDWLRMNFQRANRIVQPPMYAKCPDQRGENERRD